MVTPGALMCCGDAAPPSIPGIAVVPLFFAAASSIPGIAAISDLAEAAPAGFAAEAPAGAIPGMAFIFFWSVVGAVSVAGLDAGAAEPAGLVGAMPGISFMSGAAAGFAVEDGAGFLGFGVAMPGMFFMSP